MSAAGGRCDWQRFSCFCQLTETSVGQPEPASFLNASKVTVQGDGVDCRAATPA